MPFIPAGLTLTSASLEVGNIPNSDYMIGTTNNKRAPFEMGSLLNTSTVEPYYLATRTATTLVDANSDNIVEPRSVYTHTYPLLETTASTVLRATNVLVTWRFLGELPLFYQALVVDQDNVFITRTTIDELTVTHADGRPYTSFGSYINDGDSSVSIYTAKRELDLYCHLDGISYPLYLVPVMRYNATTPGSQNEFTRNTTTGNITVHADLQEVQFAIGYSEYLDLEQAGFPYIAVEMLSSFSHWDLLLTKGSFETFNSYSGAPKSRRDIYDFGSTTIDNKVLYGIKLKHKGGDVWETGFPMRTLLGVYDSNNTSVATQEVHRTAGTIKITSPSPHEFLYCDCTVMDLYHNFGNMNFNPHHDTNYFTNGTAARSHTINVLAQPERYISSAGAIVDLTPVGTSYTATISNEFNNHKSLNVSWDASSPNEPAVDSASFAYNKIFYLYYPTPEVDVKPAIVRGQIDDALYQFNNFDPRELPLSGLMFENNDTWDMEKNPDSRTLTITVPDKILIERPEYHSYEDSKDGSLKGGTNTLVLSSAQAYIGTYSMLSTRGNSKLLAQQPSAILRANTRYVVSVWVYLPSAWDGGNITLNSLNFSDITEDSSTTGSSATVDQWQEVTLHVTTGSDVEGAWEVRSVDNATAARFMYIDILSVKDPTSTNAIANLKELQEEMEKFIPLGTTLKLQTK